MSILNLIKIFNNWLAITLFSWHDISFSLITNVLPYWKDTGIKTPVKEAKIKPQNRAQWLISHFTYAEESLLIRAISNDRVVSPASIHIMNATRISWYYKAVHLKWKPFVIGYFKILTP